MLISNMEADLINTTCSTPTLIHALTHDSTPTLIQASTPTLVQASTPTLVQAPTLIQASTPTLIQASTPTLIQASMPPNFNTSTPTLIHSQNPTTTHTSPLTRSFTTTQEYASVSTKPQDDESQNDEAEVSDWSERSLAPSSSCTCGGAHTTCSPDMDGGWAWVVAGAAFIQFCISSGMYYSFSVFFVELLQTFEETRAKTGWVYSTNSAVHMFCGPLGGWVINRWGPRVAVMLGGLFAALGYFMTAFAPNLDVIFFTYGFVNAVGTSLNFSGWIVGLTKFWKRRHALAVGVIMSGSGFGVFFLGPVMEIIVREYGWQGAMLICAGMSFNFSVCGATIYSRLRRPTLTRGFCRENKQVMVVVNDMEKAVASCDSDINDTSEESFHSSDTFESEAHLEAKTLTGTLAAPSLVAVGSVWSLAHHNPQNWQCQQLRDGKYNMKRRIRDKTSPMHQECTGTEVVTIRQLLRSPTFWLLEASCFFSFMATTTMYAVFLDWTVWAGLAAAFSAALAGSGAGDLLGRMIAGVIMGRGLPPLILFSGIQLLLSVTIGCASISTTPWQLVAAMVGMGVACGLQSVLYALMPSQLTSGAGVGRVLGYLLFVTGAGALSGPPIAGFIVDQTESYAPVLILCTAAPAAAALLNYVAHYTSRSLASPVPQTPKSSK